MTLFNDLWDGLIHLAFPEECLGCNKQESRRSDFLCLDCLYHLPYTDHFNQPANAFERHFVGRVPIRAGAALFVYSYIIENLIHQFKYNEMTKIGKRFGQEIGQKIYGSSLFQKVDIIIPVPLHPAKFRKRGFNQSEILAAEIGDILNIPVESKILIRSKQTKTQTKQNRINRIENMNEAFGLEQGHLHQGQHVLLVDDVLTTGATLEACALKLREAGVENISMVTLAMGLS